MVKVSDTFTFVMGATYIPCDRKDFKNINVFDDIETDVLNIKLLYETPIFMIGDWNAHTQTICDYLNVDDIVAEETGCYVLNQEITAPPNFSLQRFSLDVMKVNRNGDNMIPFLISSGCKIVNGRLGSDRCIGKSTCFKTKEHSVIDYLVACDNMLPYITEFKVDMFDSCMSDWHAPIEFVLNFDSCQTDRYEKESESNSDDDTALDDNPLPTSYKENSDLKFRWSNNEGAKFNEKSGDLDISDLNLMLDDIEKCPSQDNVNHLCEKLNSKLIELAKDSGALVKKSKRSKKKVKKKVFHKQPWEDTELLLERKRYYVIKNKLKREGMKSMCNTVSKDFKRYVKSKENVYYRDLNKKIRQLRSSNSKAYWELLNNSVQGKKARAKFCLSTFMAHFKKINESRSEKSDVPNSLDGNIVEGVVNEELNKYFSVQDVLLAISKLKNGKSVGIDFIHNEFLKKSSDKLVQFYCRFFNVVLETGIVPDIWCKGLIMPLYKNKGSKDDPDNYRGITLLSCLGKLFTACLNNRISEYVHREK